MFLMHHKNRLWEKQAQLNVQIGGIKKYTHYLGKMLVRM